MSLKSKIKTFNLNRGMTYIELIVVLVIFFTMSAVVFFNSSTFRAKVEIKTLSNDIALKIVEAQKSALSGKLPPYEAQLYLAEKNITDWKPAYGVSFNRAENDKSFLYFTDLSSDQYYNPDLSLEFLESFNITKGNYISSLIIQTISGNKKKDKEVNDLSIVFTRPDSSAVFSVEQKVDPNVIYGQIVLSSPGGVTNRITIYPSGRIQIN